MTRITRLIGLAAVLILVFAATVAISLRWSRSQAEQLRTEAIRSRQEEFGRVVELVRPGAMPWSDDTRKKLESALSVTIVQRPYDLASIADLAEDPWAFIYRPTNDSVDQRWAALVRFPTPAAVRLAALYRHLTVGTLVFGQAIILMLALALFVTRRRRSVTSFDNSDTTSPFLGRMSNLARTSVQTSLELERERAERQRVQEDLHFQQVLLNRSLEEKIRLGHDLHDGIIQSLYATGLTLEAAKTLLDKNPVEARRQLDVTLDTLNKTIREVRGYIVGLAPENLRQQSFSQAVNSLAQTIDAGRGVTFDVRADEAVATRLADDDLTDLLQIVREAVSNALRHGEATQVTVRLEEDNGEVCLLVQDNGKGFDPTRLDGRGHGLGNLQARAERLRGRLRVTSSPGAGSRLVVTLPVPAAVP